MANENYVTLFDSLYLPQGLALQKSMEENKLSYTLWIICVDELTYEILNTLELNNVRLINLKNVETKELLKVKKDRTKGEYCWTLTPFAPKFVFEQDQSINRVTYIDADIYFFSNPEPIFEEFENSQKSILITEHSFSPEFDKTFESGKFCVQFIIFKRNGSESVIKWWQQRCLEWCYNRLENGKFGDQKYLDLWPFLFSDYIHILQNKELALGPWNATRYPIGNAVFYHFHGVRISDSNRININESGYKLPNPLLKYAYYPYVKSIGYSIKLLEKKGFNIKIQAKKYNFLHKIIKIIKYYIKNIKYNYIIDLNINKIENK
jgi:hypothetical protein